MRARNINPAFFKNEDLGLLDPLARILYIGLWCYCDREGRFEWRPLRIKAEILPYDNCDIDALLKILVKADEIKKYEVNGKVYGFIQTFTKHQNPHMREAPSIYPPFEEKHNLGMDEAQPRQCLARLNPESLILNLESLNPVCVDNLGKDEAQPRQCFFESGEPDEIPYKSIIDYLNFKLNTNYKHTSKKNRCLIHARWDEGYREEDFKYVIDVKMQDWFNDEKFKKFLRPETLFSTKFEGYRNQKPKIKHAGVLKYLAEKGEL